MAKVKTREKGEGIKKLDSALATGDRMKNALVRTKDTSEYLSDDRKGSPNEYAGDKVQYAAEDMSRDLTRLMVNQGRKLAHKGREALLERQKKSEKHFNEALEMEPEHSPTPAPESDLNPESPVQASVSSNTESRTSFSSVSEPQQPEPTYRPKEVRVKQAIAEHHDTLPTTKQTVDRAEQAPLRKESALKPANSRVRTEEPVPKTREMVQHRAVRTKPLSDQVIGAPQHHAVYPNHLLEKASTSPLDYITSPISPARQTGLDASETQAPQRIREINRAKTNALHRSASGLYWVYAAEKQDCQSCPLRQKCLSEDDKRGARKLEHSYFAPERQRHLARRYDVDYREALKKRQIWCEGTFAIQKWGHNLTRVLRRGLEAAEWVDAAERLFRCSIPVFLHPVPFPLFSISFCYLGSLCQQIHGETHFRRLILCHGICYNEKPKYRRNSHKRS